MARKSSDLTQADPKRVAAIAAAMWDECKQIIGELDNVQSADEALSGARDNANSKREQIMVAVAKLSESGAWTLQEVDAAAMAAGKMHNGEKSKAKSVETFCGEIRYAAHPLVRDHIDGLLSVRNDAWAIETEQLKLNPDYPAPLRKCFKRKYHAFTGVMKASRDGTVFATVDDIVAYAVANNPDHDPKNVHKRLMAMQRELAAWAVDYPADDLAHAADTLAKVTLKDIEVARVERMGVTHPQPKATPTVSSPPPITNTSPADALARAFTPIVAPIVTVYSPAIVGGDSQTNYGPTTNDIDDILGDNTANLTHIAA